MHHEVTFSCVLKLKVLPHTDKIFPLVILQLKVLGAWEIWIFKRNRRVPVKIGLIPNNDTLSQRKKIIILIVVISPFKYSAFAWKKRFVTSLELPNLDLQFCQSWYLVWSSVTIVKKHNLTEHIAQKVGFILFYCL